MGGLKSLFGGGQSKVAAPDPTPLPDTESPAVKEAEAARRRAAMARSGRSSTDLSGAGGGAYGSSLLGQ